MSRVDRALTLDEYRALVSLDEPFRASEPTDASDRPALVEMLLDHLQADGTADRLNEVTAGTANLDGDERARLRALLTVRPPWPLPEKIQTALDRLLQAETRDRPRVDPRELPRLGGLPRTAQHEYVLWQGDITTLAADAIVNAANAELLGCFHPFHPCIDNAIHAAAGPRLRVDCARIMHAQGTPEPTGHAKATRAYNLPARFVLHTVGPIVRATLCSEHEEALASCYRACLDTAARLDRVRSIAFCAVSTGVFGFPRAPAARVALRTVGAWLWEHPGEIDLVIFNVFATADRAAYEDALRNEGIAP